MGFKLVTFWPTVAWAWVAALSLNTYCKALKHNESACTQALSNDMPTMHQLNLHPLLPYEIHLLYVTMLFEAHRQQDISSSSFFGQLIPLVHSSTRGVIRSLHTGKGPLLRLLSAHIKTKLSLFHMLCQIRIRTKTGKFIFNSDRNKI